MKNVIVEYTNWRSIVEVVAIDNQPVEEVYYFDMEDLHSNIADLTELLAGSRVYTLIKSEC